MDPIFMIERYYRQKKVDSSESSSEATSESSESESEEEELGLDNFEHLDDHTK